MIGTSSTTDRDILHDEVSIDRCPGAALLPSPRAQMRHVRQQVGRGALRVRDAARRRVPAVRGRAARRGCCRPGGRRARPWRRSAGAPRAPARYRRVGREPDDAAQERGDDDRQGREEREVRDVRALPRPAVEETAARPCEAARRPFGAHRSAGGRRVGWRGVRAARRGRRRAAASAVGRVRGNRARGARGAVGRRRRGGLGATVRWRGASVRRSARS